MKGILGMERYSMFGLRSVHVFLEVQPQCHSICHDEFEEDVAPQNVLDIPDSVLGLGPMSPIPARRLAEGRWCAHS